MKCQFCHRFFLLSDLPDPQIACCSDCGQRPPKSLRTTSPTVQIPMAELQQMAEQERQRAFVARLFP
jgi:hypothetical protein